MALTWNDRTKATGTGEPIPADHPLRKGALIVFGGLRSQAAAQKSHHELTDAIEALLSADDADVDAHVQQTQKAFKKWQDHGSRGWVTPKEPRPIEQIARLERVSDDLLTGGEIEILERLAFARRAYGQRHGKSRL